MGLKFNTRREFNLPCRFNGAYKFINAENFSGGGRLPFYGGFESKSSIPDGSIHPQSYVMPQKPGNMASRTDAFITLAKLDATLIPAYNLLFSSSSSISITNAQLDQIVGMLVNAGLTLTSVQAILSGAANGTMNASGSMTITNAQCGAIIDLLAQGNCSITPNMFLSALASMECEIGGATPLSPEGLAKAVWDENILNHLNAGSTGKALSDAGSAGNPWSAPLAGNNTPNTFGWFVQKILTVTKFLGLK